MKTRKVTFYGYLDTEELDEDGSGIYEFIVSSVGPDRDVDFVGPLCVRESWVEDDEDDEGTTS